MKANMLNSKMTLKQDVRNIQQLGDLLINAIDTNEVLRMMYAKTSLIKALEEFTEKHAFYMKTADDKK